ncbi:hypothetical protein DPMN_178112 [Dreissena polymorpha]|uniref:B box-type domain-containing protein n=2 Tax=Dreissena polymorpha TaxID=45954 RepID=A0A9D4EDH6_DREPO|nr:hypothetical protein DPMN_178112 [Dreissena polymorpha]
MLHKLRRPVKDESTERGTLCVDHEKEVCSIYCDQCHILVCHLCVCEGIGKHSQHKILSLDTALEKTKVLLSSTEDKLHSVLATLTEQTSKLEENVKEIEGMHSEACKKIDQQYQRCLDDITACLAQHRQQTLDKLCTAKSVVLEQHQNHIADHSRQLEDTAALLATCGSMLATDQGRELLSRAGELPGIVGKQESTADRLQSLKQAYQDLLYDRSIHQDLKQSVVDFHTSTLDCLKALLVDDVSECQNMIPVIKTSASPGSDAVTTSSKCLTTWGFNSSTFTAEPLTRSAVWSVTVEKNTSQFGDHRAGYIFGVGISCEKVPVKEQVGMNSYSSGIICSSGNIMFSHNGKMEQLMPLDNLPLSVTVHCKVNQSKGVLLSYTITDATWGDSLHGKKILCEKFIGKPIFPVFTVSQRVKMQFPTYV